MGFERLSLNPPPPPSPHPPEVNASFRLPFLGSGSGRRLRGPPPGSGLAPSMHEGTRKQNTRFGGVYFMQKRAGGAVRFQGSGLNMNGATSGRLQCN